MNKFAIRIESVHGSRSTFKYFDDRSEAMKYAYHMYTKEKYNMSHNKRMSIQEIEFIDLADRRNGDKVLYDGIHDETFFENTDMRRYNSFFESNIPYLIHKTNAKAPILSTNTQRLIPFSISCTVKGKNSWVNGINKFLIKLKDNCKILDIDINNNFYDFGKEIDTPLNRGKEIYIFAKKKKYDCIRLLHVPQVGTEYAIINIDAINEWSKIE